MIGGSRRVAEYTVINTDESDCEVKIAKQINNYLILKKIGKGSSSTVFVAIDTETGIKYALKRINLRELNRIYNGISQIEREIKFMKSLSHPNILRLYSVLHDIKKQHVYLVLEYAEIGSLGNYIDKKNHLSESAVFSIMKQILSAISYIHNKGIVHQDIKPGNILMKKDGTVLLADFGIGHTFQSAGMVVGTPAFQAPEALEDDIDLNEPQEEDVWALGVTLYQLLFSKLPFAGENLFEIVHNINEREFVEIPEGTDPEICNLIHGMLNVDPKKRMTISQIRDNHLIKDAPDLVPDLPEPPELIKEDSIAIHKTIAEECHLDYSFTDCMNGYSMLSPSPLVASTFELCL